MRISRAGFLMLPLLLAACSLPIKQTESTPSISTGQVAKETNNVPSVPTKVTPTQQQVEAKVTTESQPSHKELIQEFDEARRIANQNIAELKTRSGDVPQKPSIMIADRYNRDALIAKTKEVVDYNTVLEKELDALNSRVEERRAHPSFGDIIQVYISDVLVDSSNQFKAQPLVGHWVRGESRIVRLNKNMLVENGISEPLRLTFTEGYQIVINGSLIGTFGPNKEKHEMSFSTPTSDLEGSIKGVLSTRVLD